MKSPANYRLAITCMLILLLSLNICYAKESDKEKTVAGSTQSSETLQGGDVIEEESPARSRFDEQQRYNHLLKEYLESLNKAESDDERIRLQRTFDEETREYKNYLAEEKEKRGKGDIERKKQALNDEYYKKLRLLKQTHDKKVRQAEEECRRDAFGVATKTNKLELEPQRCQKKHNLDQAFKRDSKTLQNDYNASLRKLKKY